MRSHHERVFIIAFVVVVVFVLNCVVTTVRSVDGAPNELKDECGHTLTRPTGFFNRHFDGAFLKKFFKHLIPFTNSARVKMQFFLYKRDFAECGREMLTDDTDKLQSSGFNAEHPTRIIIHGWMSQSKGSLNRAVKNAYLSLTKSQSTNNTIMTHSNNITTTTEETTESTTAATTTTKDTTESATAAATTTTTSNITRNTAPTNQHNYTDFNVIVVDWSPISSNVNYFGVVDLIDDLGFLLAEFMRFLHMHARLHYDDVYLIGHSLGAQIAGSAGKQIQPYLVNTIFALDPAGPKFRNQSIEYRIDPSDAHYVESIQTSVSLGFQEPVGHATFYPNYGKDQKKCYMYGCSHSRAHHYFAESLTSDKGFWGTACQRQSEDHWLLSDSGEEFKMGGEPSTPKLGTYYVKTNAKPPYALGRRLVVQMDDR